MAFRVGQKVVCIRPNGWVLDGGEFDIEYWVPYRPKYQDVLTIREVGGEWLRFFEMPNPVRAFRDGDAEARFHRKFFRPLIERKTSTGFEILDEIRKRETTRAPVRATV
jgi:hypothetical protein